MPSVITSDVNTSNVVIRHPIVNDKNIGYDDINGPIRGIPMPVDAQWQERVKGLLKAELKRRNMGYRELAEKLTAMGIPETERNIANKISRGGFTAGFFIECLTAIGCQSVRISDE